MVQVTAPGGCDHDADTARLRRLVDAALPSPAVVYDGCFGYVVWNLAYAAIRHDPATLPTDPRSVELVTSLRDASPEFREWWAEYPVRDFRPATATVDHPIVGPIRLEPYQMHPVEHPDLLLVLQVPVTGEDLTKVTTAIRHSGRYSR